LTASINVTNSGSKDGKEVVQLYIHDVVGANTRPVKELKGFQKIELKAGESKTVSFSISTNDLKYYHADMSYDWEPGEFEIMIGGDSKNVKLAKVNWSK
jgi:beta-glucosidase